MNKWTIKDKDASLSKRALATIKAALLAALTAFIALMIYWSGGTSYAFAYFMLVPMILGSAWFFVPGGVVYSFISASMMAFIPLDVESNTFQSDFNVLTRFSAYLLIGFLLGSLFRNLEKAKSEIKRAFKADPYTGMPNNIALDSHIQARLMPADDCITSQHRVNSIGLVVARFLDLFEIVEALGFDVSDELAKQVSEKLCNKNLHNPHPFRLSHSELALVFHNVDQSSLNEIVRDLSERSEASMKVQGAPVRVQLSFGSTISACPNSSSSSKKLINEARMALFKGVERKVHHLNYSPELSKDSNKSIALISKVRQALRERQFEVHYQPKVSISRGKIVGCEGLIRWRDNDGNLIPPGHFIPKIENTSLITPITEYVIEEGVRFSSKNPSAGTVALNVSAINLQDKSFVFFLSSVIEHYKLPPERLEIEITESAFIHDIKAVKQSMHIIRGIGVKISIDDFGTGYASFEYIQHLPITGLKIDRSFIESMDNSHRGENLVSCMVSIGHALDITITAEGVENAHQLDKLEKMNCDYYQGYHYSPPITGKDLSELIKRESHSARNN
ncbi:GGDEF domain-containing phosphodiesterase [Halomonas organivorans]